MVEAISPPEKPTPDLPVARTGSLRMLSHAGYNKFHTTRSYHIMFQNSIMFVEINVCILEKKTMFVGINNHGLALDLFNF